MGRAAGADQGAALTRDHAPQQDAETSTCNVLLSRSGARGGTPRWRSLRTGVSSSEMSRRQRAASRGPRPRRSASGTRTPWCTARRSWRSWTWTTVGGLVRRNACGRPRRGRRAPHGRLPAERARVRAACAARFHRQDEAESRRLLTRGVRALSSSTYAFPSLAVRARLHLAQTYGAMGDVGTVREPPREIDDVLQHRPALGVLRYRRSIDLRGGVRGAGHAEGAVVSPRRCSHPPAPRRRRAYLQTYLTIKEVAVRLSFATPASTQIGSIYRKLGVSSRSDAVHRAVTLGLLGE